MQPATWQGTRLDAWKPARKHPDTYPGERPPGSYLLLDDFVCPLVDEDGEDPCFVAPEGEVVAVDGFLADAGLPALGERVAVLAYAGNRNPATLRIKLANYGYRCPGTAIAMPVLRGTIDGADVAACGMSGQGYLFGDLLVDRALVGRTRCEVWLVLVDPDQLRVLHESEIGTGDYVAARFPGVEVRRPLRGEVLGYAARRPCFVSPDLGRPLAFGSVEAVRRTLPEMAPMEMLDHVFHTLDVADEVRIASGASPNGSMALAVASYMNRNWWRNFSGLEPEPGYRRIISLLDGRMADHALARSSGAEMASRGLAMSDVEAYHPDASLTWGRL